jgi:hypothetical protein
VAAGALPRTIGVVGLGLMGASLARAVRAADPSVRIVAVEPRDDVRAQALTDRVADEARRRDGRGARGATAVLCTPVAAIEALLGPVSRLLPTARCSPTSAARRRTWSRRPRVPAGCRVRGRASDVRRARRLRRRERREVEGRHGRGLHDSPAEVPPTR